MDIEDKVYLKAKQRLKEKELNSSHSLVPSAPAVEHLLE